MKAKTVKKSKKKICPHCSKTFHTRGLASHIRYHHTGMPVEVTAPPTVDVKKPEGKKKRVKSVVAATAVKTGAYDCLQAAIDSLKQRDQEIQKELVRLETLQAEKEAVERELEAVESAIKIFRR